MSDAPENLPLESDVSYQAVRWALYEAPIHNNPAAKALFVVLCDHWYGDPVYPSMRRLMDATSLSERTVRRSLRFLEEIGLVIVLDQGRGRQPSRYQINIPVEGGHGDPSRAVTVAPPVTVAPQPGHGGPSEGSQWPPNKRIEEDIRRRNNITSSSILGGHNDLSRTNSFQRQPDLEELPPAPEPTCAAPPAGMVPNLSDYTPAQIDNPGIWFTNHSGQRIPKFVEQPKSVRRH